MRFLIIDISNYFFRAYHAMGDLRTKTNHPTGAVMGVLNMINALLRRYPSDYIACVTDVGGKNFRHEIEASYKANRPPMPEDLRLQIKPLQECIAALGLPTIGIENVEADDVIATLTKAGQELGWDIVIASADKDLMQLVNDKVFLYDSMRDKVYDTAGIQEKFGILPIQIADYLSLVGDTSDNIQGVAKVGMKTASKWLNQWGTLDNIIAQASLISGAVGKSLNTSISSGQLERSRQLVALRMDVSLPLKLEDFKRQQPDAAVWENLCDRFEFRQLRKMVDVQAEASENTTQTRVQTITDIEALIVWCDKIRDIGLVAVDTETVGEPVMQATLVGFSLATSADSVAYIPLAHEDDSLKQLHLEAVITCIKPVLEDATITKILHNGKYDWHVFLNVGITLQGVLEDSKIAAYVENALADNTLDGLAMSRLGIKTTTYKSIVDGKKIPHFAAVPIDTAAHYAGEDAYVTRLFYDVLISRLPTGLSSVYKNLDRPIMPILARMERLGMRIDVEKLKQLSTDMHHRMQALEKEAYEIAGEAFNLNSPKQIETILFDKMGIPSVRKTSGGARSTDEQTLSQLANHHPLAATLSEHRVYAKLANTYADKLPLLVLPHTGRVHTQFNQTTVISGRLSSSSPNLQNIPIRREEGRRIRQAFIAEDGMCIICADYSQIELRLMAVMANDEAMLAAFSAGIDIHSQTAAEIFGIDLESVDSEKRRAAKAINFGLIYGMSAFGLARNIGVTQQQAQVYIDRYFGRYSGVERYMKEIRQEAPQRGFVETLYGRRIPLVASLARGSKLGLERLAINAPIQGSAADIVKMAMLRVYDWLRQNNMRSRIILQVHDELVLEVANDEIDILKANLAQLMNVMSLPVLLEVNIGCGANWDEAH